MGRFRFKLSYLWQVLICSGLACFSLFFIVRYSDIPEEVARNVFVRPEAFLGVIAVFNIVGASVSYWGKKSRKFPSTLIRNKMLIALHFLYAALILFLLNYALLVISKWMVGVPSPFLLAKSEYLPQLVIWLIEMVIIGQLQVNNFYRTIIELFEKTSELEQTSLQVQYNALQNQLNPHFLFNSLNTLISEIETDPQNAADFTRNLSDVYRYVLHFQDRRLVSLKSELFFLNAYMAMYRVRLGESMELEIRVDQCFLSCMLPPLTLQLLAENIVKHNIFLPSDPLHITVTTDGAGRWLIVSNDLRPKNDVPSSGKGLRNLSKRYELLCNKEIVVEKNNGIFTVEVPLLNEEQDKSGNHRR